MFSQVPSYPQLHPYTDFLLWIDLLRSIGSAISRKRLIIPGDTMNYGRFIVRYGG